ARPARRGAVRRRGGTPGALGGSRKGPSYPRTRQRFGPRRLKLNIAMTRRQRRLFLIGTGVGVLAIAAALVLTALRDSIVFFNSPTALLHKRVEPGARILLGGLVIAVSVL